MTEPIRVVAEGHDAQWAFWEAQERYRAFVGGVGSGKTWAGALEVLRQPPGSVVMAVAPTYTMLKDATLKTFIDLARPLVTDYNKADLRVKLIGGTEVLFRSADNPDRLRGPNLGGVWVDEATLVKEETWDILIGRLRLSPGRAWLTTTPRGRDWVWRRWVDVAGADYALIQCSTDDNKYLPEHFARGLRDQYTTEFAAQELDGQFIDPAGALFRRSWFRVVDHAPQGLRWYRYWDLATSTKQTADRTASVAAALGPDGTLYLRDAMAGRWGWPEARGRIVRTALDEPGCVVGIEAVGYQLAAYQDLMSVPELAGTVLQKVNVTRDKVSRAQPLAARAEAGKVALVRGPWVDEFIGELCLFPGGPHDDYVDAASGAGGMVAHGGGTVTTPSVRPAMHRPMAW